MSGVVRVGVVTDLHHDVATPGAPRRWHNDYDTARVEERLARGLALLRDAGVDALVVLGDVAERADDDSTARVLELCRREVALVGVVSGNHDGPRLPDVARAGGARSLDSDDELEAASIPIAGVGVAPVGDARSRFASRGIAGPDRAPLLASHYPLLSPSAEFAAAGLPYPGDLVDRAELCARVRGRGHPVVVLSGHVHGRAARADGPLLQLTFAALVEAPYEISVLEVAPGAGLVVSRRALRLGPPKPFEPVFGASAQTWAWNGSAWRARGRDDA